ncbi:MAG: acyltransferase [Alphaproteobacteria bacterium]|nr:acyltransferase [Alphaproteobacteria bacterium]
MNAPFNPGYYDSAALRSMGFAQVGEQVQVAKNCTIVGDFSHITLGDHVRIDGYTTLIATGKLQLGSRIHIAAYCHLSAGDGITMEDFSGLSQGVKIYSRTDDYSGEFLTNPTVPREFLGVIAGEVVLGRHVILGANTVVLPGSRIGEGSSIGAQSLVKGEVAPWGMYAGCPLRRLKDRSRNLLALEARLRG